MAFARENVVAFIVGVPFVSSVALVIALYMLDQRAGLCASHTGLILDYQLIALPFHVRHLDHGRGR
jgi:ABC-type maltose transport system permease subunit